MHASKVRLYLLKHRRYKMALRNLAGGVCSPIGDSMTCVRVDYFKAFVRRRDAQRYIDDANMSDIYEIVPFENVVEGGLS